ncbi:hypothetical protein AIN02nite_27460 [Acetobacter indonesiensis]|uniref:DUF4365 domain-containing protein n=2 Tax=Acetobacter indonesiensis TaxID=104101 RepID=A0A6N3T5Z2_9PROT|nr:hypothetical protein Abin_008_022 [Acetobacter indonesiensis]GEN04721.1 hypothetical protein AIN02nite_27460 [Acetobacter indonesiensis]
MKFTEKNRTDQQGVYFFSYKITKEFGHICRIASGIDVGIDATIEIVTDIGTATGAYIGVQIKSTISLEVDRTPIHYIDESHRAYWENHKLPVIYTVIDCINDRIWVKTVTKNDLIELKKSWKLQFDDSDLLERCGQTLFAKLARPSPSDPIMIQISKINQLIKNGYRDNSYTTIPTDDEIWEKISTIQRDIQVIKKAMDFEPQRYGFMIRSDLSSIELEINEYRNEIAYRNATEGNGG